MALLIEIIERVKTYEIARWGYHDPDIFSPYKLAYRGYECSGINKLQCHVCHNIVNFLDGQQPNYDQQAIIDRLNNHSPTCLYLNQTKWQLKKSDIYLRMDQLAHKTKLTHKQSTEKRIYPIIDWEKFMCQVSNNRQTELLKKIMQKYKINDKELRISFILTILGWARKSPEEIQCNICGRRVNIKDFICIEQDKQNVSQKINQEKGQVFDIFDQHRYFCFWVNDLNGWEIYIQHLYDTLGEAEELFKNKDPQDIQKIRTLMDQYLQRFKHKINQDFEKTNKVLSLCQNIAQEIQQTEQERMRIQREVLKRRQEMRKFLQDIENQLREPLKKIKID